MSFIQEIVYETAERNAARLRAVGEPGEHVGVEMNRRDQLRGQPINLPRAAVEKSYSSFIQRSLLSYWRPAHPA